MTPEAVRSAAQQAYESGLCVIPPFEDGSKRPDGSWKQWQSKRPSKAQMTAWYGERHGIGLLTGAVSGNLECFEFDDVPAYEAFGPLAEAAGLGDLVERIAEGYSERTPKGGIHWLYYCEQIAGNTKLASRPKTDAEKKHANDKVQVLIETRGEGGFVVVAPSHGPVHETGKPYEMLVGAFDTITRITPSERAELHRLARSLDRMPVKVVAAPKAVETNGRPGDDFNGRALWEDILLPQGWQRTWAHNGTTSWRRPGKSDGISATTNHAGSGSAGGMGECAVRPAASQPVRARARLF